MKAPTSASPLSESFLAVINETFLQEIISQPSPQNAFKLFSYVGSECDGSVAVNNNIVAFVMFSAEIDFA